MENPLKPSHPQDFAALYDSHFEFVYASLHRMGAATADLEDLTQEVFLIAHRRMATYDGSRPLRPWLFGIAFRVLSSSRRGLKHAQTPEPFTDDMPCIRPGPENQLLASEARTLVTKALEELPLERRAVLLLHDLHGETAPEISATLALPLNTVYSRLRLARVAFTRACLKLFAPEVEEAYV